MSCILNKYFISVFTKEELNNMPSAEQVYVGGVEDRLTSLAVTREDVLKQIVKLKPNKSSVLHPAHPDEVLHPALANTGPGPVFARVLKECKEELSDPLSTIFNKSIVRQSKSGRVPESWKVANVVPNFKKGDRSLASNYRPISITSIVGKLLESIIANTIRLHLEKHKLIIESQHGFINSRS